MDGFRLWSSAKVGSHMALNEPCDTSWQLQSSIARRSLYGIMREADFAPTPSPHRLPVRSKAGHDLVRGKRFGTLGTGRGLLLDVRSIMWVGRASGCFAVCCGEAENVNQDVKPTTKPKPRTRLGRVMLQSPWPQGSGRGNAIGQPQT